MKIDDLQLAYSRAVTTDDGDTPDSFSVEAAWRAFAELAAVGIDELDPARPADELIFEAGRLDIRSEDRGEPYVEMTRRLVVDYEDTWVVLTVSLTYDDLPEFRHLQDMWITGQGGSFSPADSEVDLSKGTDLLLGPFIAAIEQHPTFRTFRDSKARPIRTAVSFEDDRE